MRLRPHPVVGIRLPSSPNCGGDYRFQVTTNLTPALRGFADRFDAARARRAMTVPVTLDPCLFRLRAAEVGLSFSAVV